MTGDGFDQDAWLARIGYAGSRAPTLETLQALVFAHARAIAYESIDILLKKKIPAPIGWPTAFLGGASGYNRPDSHGQGTEWQTTPRKPATI